MSIVLNKNAFVDSAAVSIGLSQMFAVTGGADDPAYLVLTVLDRNEYTTGASGATGTLSGNGNTVGLANLGGDGRGTGIVFAYQASTGRYYNITYGYLDQLNYNSSGSIGDVTSLSLFGTSSFSQATACATNAYSMIQSDPSDYLGSATVVTQPKFTAAVPVQATPDFIAAVADGFVGQAWNMDGCWVLASTISADAGASLPVQSTAVGLPGHANGEWIVAFNGPAGQFANWQSLVRAGEIVVIGTAGGGGHITTCVSGSGSTAMLVDNATFVGGDGEVQNPARDGSSSDIIIAAAHPASQEWAGVAAASVVIYELDTPVVADTRAMASLAFHGSLALGSLFTATDPANKTITQWQVYDTVGTDALVVGATDYSDHSAASALTAASLATVSLLAGGTAATDTIDVRAYNGSYWGDWTSLGVGIMATAPAAPVLTAQTPAQTWTGGKSVSLAVGFADPQNETLGYGAKLSNGQALPAWLTFNAMTGSFGGTAPSSAATLTIVVTATDTSLLSATDTFSVTVVAPPVLGTRTPNQVWTEGKAVSLTLQANTFIDPQGQNLVYSASLAGGQALPAWLSFNATTETFTGTAPATAQSLAIAVTATDTSGLADSESFTATVQPAVTIPVVTKPAIAVTHATPTQTWVDGQAANLVLPSSTFTDALGLKMSFAAYEMSGRNVTSWLRFNPVTDAFSGGIPTTASGTIGLEVIATDAQHATAADLFSVTFVAGSARVASALIAGSPGPVPMTPPQSMFGLLAFPS